MNKMREISGRIWRLAKRHYIISGLVIVLAIFLFSTLIFAGNGVEKVIVERGTVSQIVQASGKAVPLQDADFSFENSGRVASVLVNAGDVVEEGDILIKLEQAEAEAEFLGAKAELAAQMADLAEIRTGTRSEEIEIAEAEKEEASAAFSDAMNNLVVNMKRAFEASDTAVRNYADQFFENTDDRFPTWKDTYTTSDGNAIGLNVEFKLKLQILEGRRNVQQILPLWADLVATVSAVTDTDSELASKVLQEREYLDIVVSFLTDLGLGVNQMNPAAGYAADFTAFRDDMATARSNVSTASVNLAAAEDKYNAAQQAYLVQAGELKLKQAGNTSETIAAQEARVEQARAEVAKALVALEKTVIRAPFSGTVGSMEIKVGEVVAVGDVVTRLINRDNFEIEANISEVNIAKLSIGNETKIVFDALPTNIFWGEVAHIEPSETIIDDVVNYKVTIDMESADFSAVKSGMTANLFIETAKKENVLTVPLFALKRFSEEGIARFKVKKIVGGKKTEEVQVELGVTGSDGRAEVISGLAENDVVVIEK